MLNLIWVAFILVGFVAALAQALQGDLDIFARVLNGLFDSAKTGFEISLGLTGILTFWMGILKIAESGGAMTVLSRIVAPFFSRACATRRPLQQHLQPLQNATLWCQKNL